MSGQGCERCEGHVSAGKSCGSCGLLGPAGRGGWVGVDLDGTLAVYDGFKGATHIGAPIAAMVERVRRRNGERELSATVAAIEDWCLEHIGAKLPITNVKDFGMIELWDDRAVQVERNTGRRMDGAA